MNLDKYHKKAQEIIKPIIDNIHGQCPKCGHTPEVILKDSYWCVDCSKGDYEDLVRDDD
jgi:ssDNA-binding Zn-finger/Zn-ribbon topoisomerase 1